MNWQRTLPLSNENGRYGSSPFLTVSSSSLGHVASSSSTPSMLPSTMEHPSSMHSIRSAVATVC